MNSVYYFYDVYPKVLKTGITTVVTVAPLDRHCCFEEDTAYTAVLVPMNHITKHDSHPDYDCLKSICRNNQLQFSVPCKEEQPYYLIIKEENQESPEPLCMLQIYGLDEDLYGLLPLKGNMHAHSFRSDGVESPELVAANYRKAGFDFLAITDHELYEPSLEAIDAFKDLDLDFRLYPGEEVHAPGNKIHILNFCGDRSVNQFFRDYPSIYKEETEAIRKELSLSDSHEDYEYASSIWVFRKIKEFGGMSILAHPNWICDGDYNAYNIPPAQYAKLLKEQPFDALELINGGNTPYENTGQLAVWHDACCQGCNVPVVGNDDSHGTVNGQWFNIGITYVLAKSNSKEDITDSIKKGLCIAVEQYHNEAPRYYGNSRLVNLFSFLDRTYFPLHDEICAQEGFFMTAYLQKNPIGEKGLQLLKGETTRLMNKYL